MAKDSAPPHPLDQTSACDNAPSSDLGAASSAARNEPYTGTRSQYPHSFTEQLLPYLFFLCLGIWVLKLPLKSSLWLDETVSWWVQSEDWLTTWKRAQIYQRPPLYFLTLKAWCSLLGDSELTMRLLSVACSIVSLSLLWLTSSRWFGRQAAWLSCFLFLFSDELLTLSMSARPYAMALMFGLGIVYSTLMWMASEKTHWLISTGIFITLTWYTHYFYLGIALVALLAVVLEAKGQFIRNKKLPLLITACLTAIACAPGCSTLLALSGQIQTLSFAPSPHLADLGMAFVPKPFALLVLFTTLLACVGGLGLGLRVKLAQKDLRRALLPTLTWILIAPLVFFVVSKLGSQSVFVSRYISWNQPGLFILLSAVTLALEPKKAKQYALSGMLLLVFVRCSTRTINEEGWRDALKSPYGVPTLIFSGLIESKDPNWLAGPESLLYLQSPVRYYQKTSNSIPPVVVPLPPDPNGLDIVTYLAERVIPLLERRDELALIVYRMPLPPPTDLATKAIVYKKYTTVEAWKRFVERYGYTVVEEEESSRGMQTTRNPVVRLRLRHT
jgi:hypothetical protein